ncbi:MAG: helix-turn-helix domain-containing protein [Acidobacteria bacterium]|nr:MAG: helix-turn-helix domain-containing protein [Acidobacteriota bacterium]REK02041.1 MAG: helix-turn-helix domain-containing protein [Acidobacteriota bacterium]REK14999.1 MAG: helix-turn-helix domain-containing protein [Acidobacteriota bacterium]REK45713.1 MAG: helix-turn-helix domain-containing protein [Acidobacteriota bacterium]
MDPFSLTTKDVAKLCKVSDATVKRWAEAGLISSERTTGGHRRFRAEEVARFQKEQSLGVRQNPGDASPGSARARTTVDKEIAGSDLFNSLVLGKEEEAANLLINSFLAGRSVGEIFDESVAGCMRRIGDLWLEGKLSVAQEHLATRAALCAVHKMRSVVPVEEACGKLLFCFALEGDFHELATHLVQITFENEGWEVMNFGSNTPLYSIEGEIRKHSPDLVCISSTVMNDVERLARDFETFSGNAKKLNIPVVLGGRSFLSDTIRSRFPATHYPGTFAELSELAKDYS